VSTDIGEVAIPSGWNLTAMVGRGTVFYITHDRLVLVVTAGKSEQVDENSVRELLQSSLEGMAQRELPKLSRTMIGNSAVYCLLSSEEPTFAGCGALRPGADAPEVVMAFMKNSRVADFDGAGGISLIQHVVTSCNALVAGEPWAPRKAP
jgi:hypothetical protein